jgi:hypothetical protein
MGAILDFQDYCEIETDGATDVTVVRRKAWLTVAGAGTDGLWGAVVVAP